MATINAPRRCHNIDWLPRASDRGPYVHRKLPGQGLVNSLHCAPPSSPGKMFWLCASEAALLDSNSDVRTSRIARACPALHATAGCHAKDGVLEISAYHAVRSGYAPIEASSIAVCQNLMHLPLRVCLDIYTLPTD